MSQYGLPFLVGRIGGMAYNFALARDFTTALAAADQAISLAPDRIWLYAKRADALMFLGRIDEARELYLKYRGQENVQGGKILGDRCPSRLCRSAQGGAYQSAMDEIETRFTSAG
jgi:hypothetical protein